MICEIRPWRLTDAPDLAAVMNNEAVLNNLRDGIPFPYTEADALDFILSKLEADDNKVFACAIILDDRAIGSIGVFRKDNIHARTAELGYCLAQDFWGRGLTTDAVRQVCRRIFDITDILRIYADPFAYNTASCRVLEKAGFVYEGLMRKNAVKNGRVLDMKLYALVRE